MFDFFKLFKGDAAKGEAAQNNVVESAPDNAAENDVVETSENNVAEVEQAQNNVVESAENNVAETEQAQNDVAETAENNAAEVEQAQNDIAESAENNVAEAEQAQNDVAESAENIAPEQATNEQVENIAPDFTQNAENNVTEQIETQTPGIVNEELQPEQACEDENAPSQNETPVEPVIDETQNETPVEEPGQTVSETAPQENKEEHKSFWKFSFESLKKTISNTTQNLIGNVVSAVEEEEEFDDFILDDMEELLIKADLGVTLASSITDKLRKQTKIKPSVIKRFLKDEFTQILDSAGSTELNEKEGLNVILVTGVNGAGKTTLIAKLANNLKKSGKKVLLAAGDTFRAAAEEQLDIWAQRAGVDIVRKDGIDAAAVVFDAIKKAQNENYEYVIIDTAGRLQNKRNLMEELNKIKNVIDKTAPGCLTESMLVLDANTGQNGLSQAKLFTEAVNLTSVALTKLDGSAKGGIIIAIAKEFGLPVKLIGVGEKIDDLKAFDTSDFLNALFEK